MNTLELEDNYTHSSSLELKRTLPLLTSATLDFVKSRYAEGLLSEDHFNVDSELDHEEAGSTLLRGEQAVDIWFGCPLGSIRFTKKRKKETKEIKRVAEEDISRFEMSVRAGTCSATSPSLPMKAELWKPDCTQHP